MNDTVLSQRDCSIPAPLLFRTVMHVSHVVSYPMYIATLIILFKETSKPFQTYKYYLIVHILINMSSETFVAFLMLPITYLPHLVIRTTGLLSYFGFSGIFQWYILATMVMITGGSISEMFHYRFTVSIFDYQRRRMTLYITISKWSFRLLVIGHGIFGAFTLNTSVQMIQEETMKLWINNPTLPLEITCPSVVMGILDDVINMIASIFYVMILTIGVSSAVACLIRIGINLKGNRNLSKATIKMQAMFTFSLCIQSGVHGAMVVGPCLVLLIARFYGLNVDQIGRFMLVCVAYHGFFSLCAMIMFTKPIRDKILCRRVGTRKEVIVSISRTTKQL